MNKEVLTTISGGRWLIVVCQGNECLQSVTKWPVHESTGKVQAHPGGSAHV
jgi:hypothetical protein